MSRSDLRAAPMMALGTLLSRLTGFLRIVALAYALGINPLSDAYNLANNTPNIIYDLVAGGILSATLVPVFVERIARDSREEADTAISSVITLAGVVLVVGSILLVLLAPAIIDLYSVGSHVQSIGAERSEAATLLRWFGPQVLFYGLCTLVTAVLNARRVFAPPMFVPIVNNVVTIFMLVSVAVLFHHPSLDTALHHRSLTTLLGAGTTVGVLAQAIALIPALRATGSHIRWVWQPRNDAVKRVITLSGWTFGFVLANQVAYFVVLALATHLHHGAVSSYTYAFTFFQLPYGVVAVSVMAAIQPELSEMWTRGNREDFRKRLGHGLSAMSAIVVPAAAGMLALSQPLVALVLGHGAASPSATISTGGALAMMALGLPGFSAYLLYVRAFMAMQDTRTVFRLYLWENGINVVLAVALAGPMGVRGLALAMSLAYSLAALIAAAQIAVPMGGLGMSRFARPVYRVVVLSVLTGVTAYGAQASVGSSSGMGLLTKVVAGLLVGVSVFLVGSLGATKLSR